MDHGMTKKRKKKRDFQLPVCWSLLRFSCSRIATRCLDLLSGFKNWKGVTIKFNHVKISDKPKRKNASLELNYGFGSSCWVCCSTTKRPQDGSIVSQNADTHCAWRRLLYLKWPRKEYRVCLSVFTGLSHLVTGLTAHTWNFIIFTHICFSIPSSLRFFLCTAYIQGIFTKPALHKGLYIGGILSFPFSKLVTDTWQDLLVALTRIKAYFCSLSLTLQ